MNAFREKLKSGKRLIGTHVNLTDHRVAEMLGHVGFDYLWFDMEHISTSFKELEIHLMGAKATGTPSLVRICWNDIPHAKRVLEAGPDAVLFPQINSVEEARQAIATCIYPPEGKRGFGPFRAIRYGLDDIQTYVDQGSKEMLRFLQIEHYAAVEAMEEMCKIPYVDGFVIGPMDLSGSLGHVGGNRTGKCDALIDRAIQTAHAAGLPIGLSTGSDDPEELTHWIRKGVDFISASTDAWSILRGAKALLQCMRDISEQYPLAERVERHEK